MNILYIPATFPNPTEGSNLYTDLAEQLKENGHRVIVLVAEEKKKNSETKFYNERGIKVLRVKSGNLYNVNVIEKAISFITLQSTLKRAIKSYLSNEKFDLILFMAPPVTMCSVVKYAMKKFNAKSYLMQKDIFPQNAVDLKMLRKLNPAYWYFRIKEKNMYKTATRIGCMSKGNIDYLIRHNKFLESDKLELFPNTIKVKESIEKSNDRQKLKEKFGIDKNRVLAIYGGNFGKPQGIEFLIRVLKEYKDDNRIYFILLGKGTESQKIYDFIKENNIKNSIIKEYIPRNEYEEILKEVDIGLVFLDYRFTIPNIPSRTLSYFEYGIPIMAATDKNTDYKDFIENETKSGLWSESNEIDAYKEKLNYLIENKDKRIELGKNGREYLEKNLTTEISVKILENSYKEMKGEKENV